MSITLIIVIMTSLISYQAFSKPEMRSKLIFYPTSVKNKGEYYRFLSHGLIHGDFGHLLINMFVLWQFGEFAEKVIFPSIFGEGLGRIMFVFFYFSAIVVASIPDYLRHQDNHAYAALGASGATSALVFAYILYAPWSWFIFPPLPALFVGLGYLWYSSYMDKKGGDNIGHNAHYWGAVYGIVFVLGAIILLQPELLDYIISGIMAGPSAPEF